MERRETNEGLTVNKLEGKMKDQTVDTKKMQPPRSRAARIMMQQMP
jgi:hypothetical protein